MDPIATILFVVAFFIFAGIAFKRALPALKAFSDLRDQGRESLAKTLELDILPNEQSLDKNTLQGTRRGVRFKLDIHGVHSQGTPSLSEKERRALKKKNKNRSMDEVVQNMQSAGLLAHNFNRIQAFHPAPLPTNLRVQPTSSTSKLTEAAGLTQDLETGDAKFDKTFTVQADNPELALSLLTTDLRAALLLYNDLPGEISFTPEAISYRQNTTITQTDTILTIVQRHESTLNAIRSAMQDNPKLIEQHHNQPSHKTTA